MFSFSPASCCCCGGTVGFERKKIDHIVRCCSVGAGFTAIEDLYLDDTRLEECDVIFCGPSNECDVGIRFSPGIHQRIHDYLSNGGRVYVGGEYASCAGESALIQINEFLSGVGSSMQIGNRQACDGGGCGGLDQGGTLKLTDVPLMENVDAIWHAATNEITGGTPIAAIIPSGLSGCTDPYTYIAIEQIGQGYVVACGDSNVTGGCSGYQVPNCKFFRNLITKEVLL